MAVTSVTLNRSQAVDLLHKIEAPWCIKGDKFFNDYARLIIEIDGAETSHRLILHRDGSWSLQAEIGLD